MASFAPNFPAKNVGVARFDGTRVDSGKLGMGETAIDETEIRKLCDGGDYRTATTRILRTYGPEIFRFLYARLRAEDLASDAFSQFTEDLWRGLHAFRWRCSARAWAYTVARHAASRTLDATRRNRRLVPLSDAEELAELEYKVRTQTLTFLRSEVRGQLERLRDELPAEDQMLLLLRVNRHLRWKEIAQVILDDGQEIPAARLVEEATRLRKRFQMLKEKLRRMSTPERRTPE